MRMKGILTAGFLSVLAATAAMNGSDSFAADAHRVDVIDAVHETVAQADSVKPGGERMRVDVIDRIESDGPVYSYAKPMSR